MTAAGDFTAGREKRRTRPKGYARWSPQAKTSILLEQVYSILDEYARHLPLTVRQIFYRLVAAFDYPKTENAYSRLAEALVMARRSGRIPFDYIRDDGVVIYSSPWHEDVEDFWNETGQRIRGYRRDRQAGQPQRLELWCEAAGMAPQLARAANDFSVPVFSSGGFASLTAVRNIADRALEQTVPTVLLHVGDFDPSGESIFASIAADAAAFVQADRPIMTIDLTAKRVALTGEQVERYALPTAPAKASDSRSRRWTGETCQLEALAPDHLAELVRGEISPWFEPEIFRRQLEREQADRAELYLGLPRGSE